MGMGCTVTATLIMDLDAAELASPGSFINQPLTIVLSAGDPAPGGAVGQPVDVAMSGRTLARLTVEQRVSVIHSFDMWSGCLVLPWPTFPASPLKFRTVGSPQYGFKPRRAQSALPFPSMHQG